MRIGVDVGGTKIEAALVDSKNRIRGRERMPTPRDNYRETLQVICSLVRSLERDFADPLSVGIGIPGSLSPATGLVQNANSTWLIGERLDADIASALDREVRLANDANCFALSEAREGAGAGAQTVFGVILGTGVGGGLVVGGRIIGGPNRITGEWGHNPLPWPRESEMPGRPCYCGRMGCLETWLSGPALEADYAQEFGEARSPIDISSGINEGEDKALSVFARYEDRLARGLATVVNLIDPEIIVLGGGLSNIDRLYTELPGKIGKYAFCETPSVKVVKNMHGDSSGVRGAAMLWEGPA